MFRRVSNSGEQVGPESEENEDTADEVVLYAVPLPTAIEWTHRGDLAFHGSGLFAVLGDVNALWSPKSSINYVSPDGLRRIERERGDKTVKISVGETTSSYWYSGGMWHQLVRAEKSDATWLCVVSSLVTFAFWSAACFGGVAFLFWYFSA